MREKFSMMVERGRALAGPFASKPFDRHGAFIVKMPKIGHPPQANCPLLAVLVGAGGGWEHVSVSILESQRCPRWDEMCWVKELFFADDECVMQLHVPKADYVSHHPSTLHLWRPQTPADGTIPRPPSWMVGPRDSQTLEEAEAEGEAALRARGEWDERRRL